MGPEGPGSISYFFSGRLDSEGSAVAELPPEAGSIDRLPQLDCYVSELASGPYIAISSDTYDGNACGFVDDGASLAVVLITGDDTTIYAGWYYQIIVRPQDDER